jgi:cell fate regulator YaaT (PSP1 superfamily)
MTTNASGTKLGKIEDSKFINPTKISGLRGRLMCCLAFEDETLGRLYAEEEKVKED